MNLADALQNAVNALADATAKILGFEKRMEDKLAASLADNRQVIAEAVPLVRLWCVDPNLGNDGNSGRTPATALKTIDAVAALAAPSTKHVIFLFGDIQQDRYTAVAADIQIRGSSPFSDGGAYPYASARRRLTFRPEAINSPRVDGTRSTAGFVFATRLNLVNVDVYLADVPPGMYNNAHLLGAGSADISIDLGDIYATTPGGPGRLIDNAFTSPTAFWFSGVRASAAAGRIFAGVATGADPNVGKRYNSNVTAN